MSHHRLPALACLALTALAPLAHADRAPRIGVVIALRINVEAPEADALGARLGAALNHELVVEVIAGDEAARRVPTAGLPDNCLGDPACIKDLGARLDADQLLLLVLTGVGAHVNIDPTWAEVASGRIVSREALIIEDRSQPSDDTLRAAASHLLPEARARPPATPPTVTPPDAGVPEVVPTPIPTPTGRGRHMTTAAWIAGGVAALALTGAVIFGLEALGDKSSLVDDHCDKVHCDPARVDTMENHAHYSDALSVVTLGAAVTGLILYLRSGHERPPVDVAASRQGFRLDVVRRF